MSRRQSPKRTERLLLRAAFASPHGLSLTFFCPSVTARQEKKCRKLFSANRRRRRPPQKKEKEEKKVASRRRSNVGANTFGELVGLE